MRAFALAIPFALAAAMAAAPAFAFPHINVINVETLSTAPLRVRTTFTFELVGYEPIGYAGIEVFSSGAGPAVQFFDAVGDADFSAYVSPAPYNGVSFDAEHENAFNGIHTLSITTDQQTPCVYLNFWNPLLAKHPSTNEDYIIPACLSVDMPTAARALTWGTLKGIYR